MHKCTHTTKFFFHLFLINSRRPDNRLTFLLFGQEQSRRGRAEKNEKNEGFDGNKGNGSVDRWCGLQLIGTMSVIGVRCNVGEMKFPRLTLARQKVQQMVVNWNSIIKFWFSSTSTSTWYYTLQAIDGFIIVFHWWAWSIEYSVQCSGLYKEVIAAGDGCIYACLFVDRKIPSSIIRRVCSSFNRSFNNENSLFQFSINFNNELPSNQWRP